MGMLFSIILILILTNYSLKAAAEYHYCYPNDNYTSKGNYGTSQSDLLFALPAQVNNQGGYYSGNKGGVYCLGLCRLDLTSTDTCNICITSTSNAVVMNCQVEKEAISWGEDAGCMVRCAPRQFSQSYENQPFKYFCNSTEISTNDSSQFTHGLTNITSNIAVRAIQRGSSSSFPTGYTAPEYFAADILKINNVLSIYALGYCLPTLAAGECTACLKAAATASELNCTIKQGATIFAASCVLRYEIYPFFNSTSLVSSPPTSPPPVRSSPSRNTSSGIGKGDSSRVFVAVGILLPMIAFAAILFLAFKINQVRIKKKQNWLNDSEYMSMTECTAVVDGVGAGAGDDDIESCFEFSFDAIRAATNNFGQSNKLGQGGFGAVYKGRLPNGELVAIKRLTRYTAQREEEFRNEVTLVARLHHRNLARLMGFSLEENERILVYELAFNGSLDSMLFDPVRREHLTWQIRYKIIEGVARGLVYLHEGSQLKIIHRDLKASNVLLDESMNAKISDFGTARLFSERQGTASKIVGTYGYMAPEYAKFGRISTKVDVFSFGVLLLEIISGRKNTSTSNSNKFEHLLTKAWNCWMDGKLQELVDPLLVTTNYEMDEIARCVHTGLLCVQANAAKRPCMSQVILVLECCSQTVAPPLEPGYLLSNAETTSRSGHSEAAGSSYQLSSLHYVSSIEDFSVNEATLTDPEPR